MTQAEMILPYHPKRDDVELHIRNIYTEKYGSTLPDFPHILLAIFSADGDVISACGIRFSTTGFFSSIYTDEPISDIISANFDYKFNDDDILEVTTLVSSRMGHAVKLVQQVVALSRQLNKPIGLFTTTQKLHAILKRAGMQMIQIADADAMRVHNPENWGTYYDANPAVYAVWDNPSDPITLKYINQNFRVFPFHVSALKPKEPLHV